MTVSGHGINWSNYCFATKWIENNEGIVSQDHGVGSKDKQSLNSYWISGSELSGDLGQNAIKFQKFTPDALRASFVKYGLLAKNIGEASCNILDCNIS